MAKKAWRKRQHTEKYFKRAKAEGYRARSVYKFDEINKKFRLIKSGDVVLDLGAAPGSWSQIAQKIVGKTGKVIAVDIQPMSPISGVTIIQGDVRDPEVQQHIRQQAEHHYFDAVISDIAPNTTGIPLADHARSIELSLFALATAIRWLRPGGNFITKVFQGEDFPHLFKLTRRYFRQVKSVSPAATRKESKEIFMVAHGLRARADLDPHHGLMALLALSPQPVSGDESKGC
ncbi:MAG: RlmE family RNA methyltransferase [Gemmatimonadetes bacterium]|nr:MAG: RlmE family RNA methyltransferase [Gemmatimonadota bacterium]